eukprot:352100-Chlamydomonas_euryale.AAC.4
MRYWTVISQRCAVRRCLRRSVRACACTRRPVVDVQEGCLGICTSIDHSTLDDVKRCPSFMHALSSVMPRPSMLLIPCFDLNCLVHTRSIPARRSHSAPAPTVGARERPAGQGRCKGKGAAGAGPAGSASGPAPGGPPGPLPVCAQSVSATAAATARRAGDASGRQLGALSGGAGAERQMRRAGARRRAARCRGAAAAADGRGTGAQRYQV